MYDLRIEAKSVPTEKQKLLVEAMNTLMGEKGLDNDGEEIDEVAVQGLIVLHGGESTGEAHKRIEAVLLKLHAPMKVVTRWHYAEWSWENEYGDEPE